MPMLQDRAVQYIFLAIGHEQRSSPPISSASMSRLAMDALIISRKEDI